MLLLVLLYPTPWMIVAIDACLLSNTTLYDTWYPTIALFTNVALSEPDSSYRAAPVGVVLGVAGAVALVVGAIMTAVLRATGGIKTVQHDGPASMEMGRLKSNQEDSSLDEPFLPNGLARAPHSCQGGDALGAFVEKGPSGVVLSARGR